MSPKQSSTEHQVMSALAAQPETTVAEIASATSLGRSTVGKALVTLERSRKAHRVAGERQGATRLPDRWTAVGDGRATRANVSSGARLKPGQLDEFVLDYVRSHTESGPLGPTAVAKGLKRSSGAVGNCLERLAKAGEVSRVSTRPRRYASVTDGPHR
jgi:DNA-binding transcriptional ArsR family regulator